MISDVLGLILLVSDGRSGRQEQEKYPSAETTRNLFWKIFSKISLELFSQIFLGSNKTENHFFQSKISLEFFPKYSWAEMIQKIIFLIKKILGIIFTNILGQKQYRKQFLENKCHQTFAHTSTHVWYELSDFSLSKILFSFFLVQFLKKRICCTMVHMKVSY